MIDTDLFHSNYIGRDGLNGGSDKLPIPKHQWGNARESKNSKVITDANDESILIDVKFEFSDTTLLVMKKVMF